MRFKPRLFALGCCFGLSVVGAAQKPVVDTTKSPTNQTLTSEELDKIPTGRNIATLLRTLPPAPGFATNVKSLSGMDVVVFTTPDKEIIELYVPNDIVAGQSFTGTMRFVSPPSNNGAEQKQNYSFSVGIHKFKLEPGPFHIYLAKEDRDLPIELFKDTEGRVASWSLPVRPSNFSPSSPEMPSSGTSGNNLK